MKQIHHYEQNKPSFIIFCFLVSISVTSICNGFKSLPSTQFHSVASQQLIHSAHCLLNSDWNYDKFSRKCRIYSKPENLVPELETLNWKTRIEQNVLGGTEISPEILAILTVYFVQGALGLSRLAVTYFMKDELHLSPAEVAAFGGITTLPWLIKPLYGFLSDGVPIFGYKRRSYLVIAGIMGCLSWLALGSFITTTNAALLAIILGSASVAISDVVADSIVVEKSRSNQIQKDESNLLSNSETNVSETNLSEAGNLQSLCWTAASVGGIFSSYFSGSLLETVSPRVLFTLTAIFPLLISASSFLIDEVPVAKSSTQSTAEFKVNVGNQLIKLKETFTDPRIYLPVLFIFCWQATPSPDTAMFFFSTNELEFKPEFFGRIRLLSNLAALGGVTLYRTKLKDISIKTMIFWTTLISVPLSLSQLLLVTHYNRVIGIPDQLFALTDTVVLTVLGQIAFMPTLVLASSVCPPGVEGTLFASLMSIYNAAGTLSSEIGAGLTAYLGVTDTSYEYLPTLIAICSLSSLLPLLFINLLDNATVVNENNETLDSKIL